MVRTVLDDISHKFTFKMCLRKKSFFFLSSFVDILPRKSKYVDPHILNESVSRRLNIFESQHCSNYWTWIAGIVHHPTLILHPHILLPLLWDPNHVSPWHHHHLLLPLIVHQPWPSYYRLTLRNHHSLKMKKNSNIYFNKVKAIKSEVDRSQSLIFQISLIGEF